MEQWSRGAGEPGQAQAIWWLRQKLSSMGSGQQELSGEHGNGRSGEAEGAMGERKEPSL